MRRTLISALAVLLLAAALCAMSARAVGRAVNAAESLRQMAEKAATLDDTAGALQYMMNMERGWQAAGRWLELIISHDALADVRGGIADARVCLQNGDRDEFLRASAVLEAALESLHMTEAVRLMNLF